MEIKKLNLFKIFTVIFFFSLFTNLSSKEQLLISSIPDESLSDLSTKFEPLITYLKKELLIDVKFVPVTNYSAVVEALSKEKVQLAWLGGFTFVQAKFRSKNNVRPIIQRKKDQKFKSVFITHKSNKINNLKDLKGKTFSFGSPSSTSGHLMPRYFLMKNIIKVDDFFKRVAYSGAHDATIFSVLSQKVDGGVLNELVWKKFKNNEKELAKNLKVIYETEPFYDYNWTILKSVDKKLKEQIVNAFLKLNKKNDTHKKILDLQRADYFIPTYENNYKKIEEIAKKIGLIN